MSEEFTQDPELEPIEGEFTEDEYAVAEQNESQALALRPVDAQSLFAPSNTAQAVIARRDAIQELVNLALVDGVHYGQIPGTQGKSLWLPGAEAIAAQCGLQVDISLQEKDVDRSANPPYVEYRYKAIVRKGRDIITTCEGSCNSYEDCFKVWVPVAVPDEKTQQEKITAKTGKWDEWNNNRTWKEKLDPPNVYSIINNIQKRAQKRAYVGAIEKATGVSGFFAKAAAPKQKHFGEYNSAPSNSAASKSDNGPTQFWKKVGTVRMTKAEAQAIADRAAKNEITWDQAIEELTAKKAA